MNQYSESLRNVLTQYLNRIYVYFHLNNTNAYQFFSMKYLYQIDSYKIQFFNLLLMGIKHTNKKIR